MGKQKLLSVKNEHFIRVNKMCASCFYKTVDFEGERICEMTQTKVEQRSRCRGWKMSDGMRRAGYSGGMVKRREYLMYVFGLRMQGCVEAPDSLRRQFMEQTGLTPFIIR